MAATAILLSVHVSKRHLDSLLSQRCTSVHALAFSPAFETGSYAAFLRFRACSRSLSPARLSLLGEYVADVQVFGQIQQCHHLLYVGPHHAFCPRPLGVAIGLRCGGLFPTTTGRTPPGTARAAAGSRRFFFCSSCAVEASRRVLLRDSSGLPSERRLGGPASVGM